METQCARCQKTMDVLQGYKFGPNQYLCVTCYDAFKKERAAKRKQQQATGASPDHIGAQMASPGTQQVGQTPGQAPPQAPPMEIPPQQAPASPMQSSSGPIGSLVGSRPAEAAPAAPTPPPATAPPKAAPSADICDVCKKPIPDFKVPLKGGKKACMGCNDILREVAKSIILNIECPHCGKEFTITQD